MEFNRKQIEDLVFNFLDNLTQSDNRIERYNEVMSLVDDIEKIADNDLEVEDLQATVEELEDEVDQLKSTVNYIASETEDFVFDFEKKLNTELDTNELKKDLKRFKDTIHESSWYV